jgi:chromosome segregation ATPase
MEVQENAGNTTESVEQGQVDQQSVSDEAIDYESLYKQEVSNSKKLRKRAQESESLVTQFNKEKESAKMKTMEEQKQFESLSEELKGQVENLTPYKERWEAYEANKRESLMSQVPEEDKEQFGKLDLEQLEFMVNKLHQAKPSNPNPAAGAVRTLKNDNLPKGNPFEADQQTLKENWADVLARYNKK